MVNRYLRVFHPVLHLSRTLYKKFKKDTMAAGKVEGSWQDHVAMDYRGFSLW
jgi:hypothetical protein